MYDETKDWHKIALEYRAEISHLHNEILTVAYCLKELIEYNGAVEELCQDYPEIKKNMNDLFNLYDQSDKIVDDIERLN